MDKRIIIYGITLALLMSILKMLEYKLVVIDHSFELYGAALAVIFTAIGIAAGRKLTPKKEVEMEQHITVPAIIQNAAPDTTHIATEKIGP